MTSRFAALVLATAGAALCALPADAEEPGLKVITTSVPSSGAHKECISLAKSQNLRYWFRADGLLNFDVQAQTDDKVSYLLRRDRVTMSSGTVMFTGAEVYCMVLTNVAGHPVTVRLEFAKVSH